MKKVLSAIVLGGALAGVNAVACGGMTQISPPGFQMQTGQQTNAKSILDSLAKTLVLA